ncbi:ABC transporter ATP-binding protein [Staphylococcus coagulans]|uniref:staphylopine uptake ABC transporter ATP-binding protein CntD n=1 Tax=Staphylococcus coagulans TaxID=74706 RepID=UPI001BED0CC5|nr:ABC transporter ATP-binding protein [Staphylococcus coagulans]MBT2829895.1 ABC transporter ATP-binding protein [Staphylococcus coagulans]MBT2860561.1 ABC transporter ATP-binding protein [Staphylococcus coagulans]MBU3873592.1 ABC transporter ATP-binding protein [Staphylococcus coagulans]
MQDTVMHVEDLTLIDGNTNDVLVHHCNFTLHRGEVIAIIGESGSGKSVTCKALLGINDRNIRMSGQVTFQDQNLHQASEQELRKIRGRRIAMIMQQGGTAFNPTFTVGTQMKMMLQQHRKMSEKEQTATLKHYFDMLGLRDFNRILKSYPHQLSGGMLQRLMIILALALKPDMIIADEPTTALDAITQYEVIEELREIKEKIGCAMLFVSHDLAVVKSIADTVLVMRHGDVVESGPAEQIFNQPQHEYTQFLIAARDRVSKHFKALRGDMTC